MATNNMNGEGEEKGNLKEFVISGEKKGIIWPILKGVLYVIGGVVLIAIIGFVGLFVVCMISAA
jgi:hypothetical protein